ncbi:hypothetical protein TRIP_B300002 [uncultured Desulfatiglans sp.]|nr:hypothetical protein TRIP_B300002 [uncultured Desulfatiglans sp.]
MERLEDRKPPNDPKTNGFRVIPGLSIQMVSRFMESRWAPVKNLLRRMVAVLIAKGVPSI